MQHEEEKNAKLAMAKATEEAKRKAAEAKRAADERSRAAEAKKRAQAKRKEEEEKKLAKIRLEAVRKKALAEAKATKVSQEQEKKIEHLRKEVEKLKADKNKPSHCPKKAGVLVFRPDDKETMTAKIISNAEAITACCHGQTESTESSPVTAELLAQTTSYDDALF